MHARHRVVEQKGYAVVLQTLDDVALQAAGIGHDLRHKFDFRALPGHAPGHNQANIAGTEDDHALAGQIAVDVGQPLRRARRVDARGPRAGNAQCTAGPLAAAHGQYHRAGLQRGEPALGRNAGHRAVLADLQHHRVQPDFDVRALQTADEALYILRPGQFLAEEVQAKAVVDALLQNAAQRAVALEDDDLRLRRFLSRLQRRRQARGPAADDDYVKLPLHLHTSPRVLPATM